HHPRTAGGRPRRPHRGDARRRTARTGLARPGEGKMTLSDVMRSAVLSLRGNWRRSILTALGVIIGIAAVIVMVSVGQGTQAELDSMISKLGSNRLEVFGGSARGPARGGAGSQASLTDGDAQAIRDEIAEVQYVATSV